MPPLGCGEPRAGERLGVVLGQMQRLADEKHRVLDRVARALAERKLRLGKVARRVADEVEDRGELAGRGFARSFRGMRRGVPAWRDALIAKDER